MSGKFLHGFSNFPWSPEFRNLPETGCTVLLGGIHGNEPATVQLLQEFIDHDLPELPADAPTLVLPCCNPDGLESGSRYNARGVDLNRNFPWRWEAGSPEPSGPEPLSEPESQALHRIILQVQPRKIVSLHWALAEVDADGPQSKLLGQALWAVLNDCERAAYRLRVGPPRVEEPECPGSLGQWCGYGLLSVWGWAPAMVTLELPAEPLKPRDHELPPEHLQTIQKRWKNDPSGYLLEARPAVRKMLRMACTFPVVE